MEGTARKQILFSGCLASPGHFAWGASGVPSGSGDVHFCPFVRLPGRDGGKVLGHSMRSFLGKVPQRMEVSPGSWGISPCSCLMAHVSPVRYGDCSLHAPSSPPTFICLLFCVAARLQGEGQAHRQGSYKMRAFCGDLSCGPWVPGRHSLFLLFPPGSLGQLLWLRGQSLVGSAGSSFAWPCCVT